MNDLAEFLRARFAEDEAVALAAAEASSKGDYLGDHGPAGPTWAADDGMIVARIAGEELDVDLWDCEGSDSLCMAKEHATHLARHDPARVIAECDAKRQIVEDLQQELANQHDPEPTTLQLAERTLLALALPYADHPDYREEWRP